MKELHALALEEMTNEILRRYGHNTRTRSCEMSVECRAELERLEIARGVRRRPRFWRTGVSFNEKTLPLLKGKWMLAHFKLKQATDDNRAREFDALDKELRSRLTLAEYEAFATTKTKHLVRAVGDVCTLGSEGSPIQSKTDLCQRELADVRA